LEYLQGADVLIHNAPFDVGFINKELELQKRPPLKTYVDSVADTLAMAKDMFPGKRNSLDALCDRLGVDNSGRTLHGALLDAELLADVYIYMTRGQDALLIEVEDSSDSKKRADAIDMQSLKLTVISASEQELAAHEEVLLQIDKASNNQTVWRSAQERVA
jgi:DNA polymerase-3 subunit epsilon